jgi:plasmid stabilization system protein ParE
MRRIRYTATALAELEDILTHIAQDNPSAALRVSVTVLATIDRVLQFPHTAIETNVPQVRVAPALPYRYLVFFTVTKDALIVRNVRHSARDRSNL